MNYLGREWYYFAQSLYKISLFLSNLTLKRLVFDNFCLFKRDSTPFSYFLGSLHEYTNVSLRCILTFEWKWEVSNAQRMVRRISTKQGHSNFCRHPENDARPSSSRNSRWYVYIIKEQKTRNLHKLSSPTKISVYIYPCYCTTTFWNLTFASCNNNAGHHQKVKISPRKNIFHCNPFYCILWKSTVYLPHVSFKTKTPRVQRRGVF